jgi:ABC-type branched-subunit amino acid transport system ATPase component
MTVRENLEMGAITYSGDRRKRMDEVAELFPTLPTYFKKRASQLSGGEQRMVALGRVLMGDPKMIIMDEPTAGLSPLLAGRVWEQIARIRGVGIGLLVVEQNAAAAMEHADFAYVLSDGRNYLSGPASELALREELASILVG